MGVRLLLLTNVIHAGGIPGQGIQAGRIEGYEHLVGTGEIQTVDAVSMTPPAGHSVDTWFSELVQRIVSVDPSHISVWNPSLLPEAPILLERLDDALRGRFVIFWDGDAWGPPKLRSEPMLWWIRRADAVFTVAGHPQSTELLSHGARAVYPTLPTYDHLMFDDLTPVPTAPGTGDCVFIGSNTAKLPVPGLGLPGSSSRWAVVLALRARLGSKFHLYGGGWGLLPFAEGALPFQDQVTRIRAADLTANWDHYPGHADYSSDRLAVAMLAGRPQVTRKHPGLDWLSTDLGVVQAGGPFEAASVCKSISEGERTGIQRQAVEGSRWVRGRLSDREAARHMMSTVVDGIRRPPAEPWDQLWDPLTQ